MLLINQFYFSIFFELIYIFYFIIVKKIDKGLTFYNQSAGLVNALMDSFIHN